MGKRACDIKDAQAQNIVWTPPQGGSGPNYPNMGSLGSWSIYPPAFPRPGRVMPAQTAAPTSPFF
ncbi:4Fe-4S dicluster domain-containing protein [Aeromonas media]|uniref:4Fe-4S dicluster domain-containing protein n=1 Tax=Aeromonas rivipollensis TaxID=948519 RepID=UPI00372D4B26